MSLWSRLVNVIRGDRLIGEIDEELASHIAEAIAHGRDPEEARRSLGAPLRQREASLDIRRVVWLDDFRMDIRYAARTLRREPAFLAAAVLSLGLGIGVNTAIFSVIDAVLLRSLPVSHPEQLVLVRDSASGNLSYPDYLALRQGTRMLSDLIGASSLRKVPVGVGGGVEQGTAKMVSGNYFVGLGVPSAIGRVFTVSDEMAPVAVISRAYWRRRFDESPGAVGEPISINGLPFTIVGVAPATFTGESVGESPDVWTSMALETQERRDDRGFTWLYLMGRLQPGASSDQAQAELASLLVRSRPTAPPAETLSRLNVAPGARGLSTLRERVSKPLLLLMVLAVIVLLVACTNLAGLLLTRGAARRWEIAMRMAIGASRARVIRQLLTESLLLAVGGGAIGVALAMWGSAALLRLLPSADRSVSLSLGPDLRMLLFAGAVSIAAGGLFGLAPAWRAARSDALRWSPRVAGRERPWGLRGALIVLQVALSLVLLAGSIMFIRTLRNLATQDLGFRADHVLLVQLAWDRGYRPTLSTVIPRLLDRASSVPGVASVSVALGGTFDTMGGARVQVEGSPTRDRVSADWVGPDYFRTAGIALIAGRDFSATDGEHAPKVMIVNQRMARRYFDDGQALGRHVIFNKDAYEIVGIARDAKYGDLRESTPPLVYFSTLQTHSGINTLEVRTAGADPLVLGATIRSLIHDVDPHLSAGAVMTLNERIDRRLGAEHLVADLTGFFGLLTLAVLSIGIYGVLAYSVAQRTKEIGVRLALGARRSHIVWMVLRQIVGVVALGAIAGSVGVLAAGRLVKPLLFGVTPADPWTIGCASVLLLGIAVLAGGLPARAAARLDPATVLRE
jgi:predicted permease